MIEINFGVLLDTSVDTLPKDTDQLDTIWMKAAEKRPEYDGCQFPFIVVKDD